MDKPAIDEAKLEEVRKGIAAYSREQTILLRLLRKRRSFTERDFDKWLHMREYRRPRFYPRCLTGDTFILGLGRNGGTQWAVWLELMQKMMLLGLIDAKKENGLVVYRLPSVPVIEETKE